MPFRRLSSQHKNNDRKRVTDTRIRSRVPVDLLKLNMRVIKLDRPWTEVPVLFQGLMIEDTHQLGILRQHCDWVWVEGLSSELLPIMDQLEERRRQQEQPLPEQHSLQQELPRAKETFTTGIQFVSHMMSQLETGNDLDLTLARPMIQRCAASITANANAMFWMNRIKDEDAYTAEHCLRVSILAMAFARYLGMSGTDMETAGLCGLLHDIGKMQVPNEVLNKPGSLTQEEMEIVRQHAALGYEMLQSHHTLEPIVAAVCRDHHERLDGKGYPRGLQEWQISRFARLISIVDVFDAITSDRCYRRGMPTTDAMRILFRERGKQFDPGMIEAFIRMIGVYPPGSLVELNSGEVAVVLATHPAFKLRPRVEILLDVGKNPVTPRVIDLKDSPENDSGQLYAIVAPLPDGAYGLSLSDRVNELTQKP